MGKKKHKRNRHHDMDQFSYFGKYAKRHNRERMEDIRDELEKMIDKIHKEDKKFDKLKTKKKKGKYVVDIEDNRLDRPYNARRSFVDLFQSKDFGKVLRYIARNIEPLMVIIAQLVATLIVLVLGCKKLRETIPINTIRRMQKTYDMCSNVG